MKSYIISSKDLKEYVSNLESRASTTTDDDLLDSIRFLKRLHREKYGKPNEEIHGVKNAIHEEP